MATLLVVGATFAYFTATNTPSTTPSTTEINTAKVGGTTLTFAPEAEVTASEHNLLDYPGGYAVFATQAKATKTDPTDENNYTLGFNLKITYTNGTETELDYTIYKSTTSLSSSLGEATCQFVEDEVSPGKINYYYTSDGQKTSAGGSDCSGPSLTTELASGKLSANKTSTDIVKTDVTELGNQTVDTDDTDGVFYYVIVKYPNKADSSGDEGNQNNDMGKPINVSLTIDGEISSAMKDV